MHLEIMHFILILLSSKNSEHVSHTHFLLLLDLQENAFLSSSLLFPAATVFCIGNVFQYHHHPSPAFRCLSIPPLALKHNWESSCVVIPWEELLLGPTPTFCLSVAGDMWGQSSGRNLKIHSEIVL